MQWRLKWKALALTHRICPSIAFLVSVSLRLLSLTSILIFRLRVNVKNSKQYKKKKKRTSFHCDGNSSVVLASLSPRMSHHSKCTENKASFLWLWALLGMLVCSAHRHVRERNVSWTVSTQPPGSQQETSHWPRWTGRREKRGFPQKERQVFVAENSRVTSTALSIPVRVLSLALTGKPQMETHM